MADRFKTYIAVPEGAVPMSERTSESATHIKVEAYYAKGGVSYFTYKNEPRGYWLMLSAVKCETRASGVTMESMMLFGNGFKFFVKEATRLNRKTLEAIGALVTANAEALAAAFLAGDKPALDAKLSALKELA